MLLNSKSVDELAGVASLTSQCYLCVLGILYQYASEMGHTMPHEVTIQ
jgi:hypothetical protein